MPRIALWLLLLYLAMPASPVWAQAPFQTDDVEVAPKRHWHFEFNNEYDWLQASADPNLRQNTSNFKVSYGLIDHLEVGFDNQLLAISNAPSPFLPNSVFGYGDIDLSVKWHVRKEKKGSPWPALGASLNLELPTGDEQKQLGSGVTDYYLNTMAQKSITEKNTVRLNAGIYFAGNTVTGAEGLRTTQGHVYTFGISVVRDFTSKLDLGIETYAAVSGSFGRDQLQLSAGGNYKLKKNLSIDFALIKGFYEASPTWGPLIGFSVDF